MYHLPNPPLNLSPTSKLQVPSLQTRGIDPSLTCFVVIWWGVVACLVPNACLDARAVASLTVPGGQSSTFLIFSSNFDQFVLFFLKLYSFSSSFWYSGWASRPPGKALATPLLDAQGTSPSEAGKLCIFETGIMQFCEYFWAQI